MKRILQGAAVCMCLLLFICSAQAQDKGKIAPEKKIAGHSIIQINNFDGLDPKLAMVKAGTTVIWMNHSDSNAEIQFRGKGVTLACKSPTHFVVDDEGSFISDRIPPSSVASLCFIEKGTYNYELKRGPRRTADVKTDLPIVSGTIVVE